MTTCLGMDVSWPILSLLLVLLGLSAVSAQTSGSTGGESTGEIRRGLPMHPDGKTRSQLFFERIIREVQPDLVGTPDRLTQYMALFKRAALNDGRLIAFDVQAHFDGDRDAVVLTGFIEYQEHRDALNTYLGVLGFEVVDDQTQLMPTPDLGDLRFGVVQSKSTFLYRKPDPHSETLTQSRQGDPVFLLRPAENGFYLCHAWDGYVGFVDGRDLQRVDAQGLADAMPKPDTDRIDPAIQAGSRLIDTPYKWGGTTDAGIDCSGLMRHSFKKIGLLLPRDTDQQALVGRLTATRWHRDNMRRGDLMFFMNSRGRINHTAVYLGDHKLLESGGPGVRIQSLDPSDPDYNEKRDQRFCFAKRVIE